MFDDDDAFKDFNERFNHDFEENRKQFERSRHAHEVMSIVVPVLSALVMLVVIAVCCRVCCRARSRGRILAPPTVPPAGAALYPQQQYTVAVGSYPVQASGAPYAAVSPYPAHPAPHPAPYPPHSAAPYPAHPAHPAPHAAPYPAHAAHPVPYAAPSAPHADAAYMGTAPPGWNMPAQPPSYDQVQSEMKTAPYNPNYPH